MVEDVRIAVEGRRPVEFYGRTGGNVPAAEEVLAVVNNLAKRCSLVTELEATYV
jgi:2-oxoglutarate ferredoxin oxidoreductase subunit alpha